METIMNPDTVFQYATRLAMLGWVLLIFVPRWKWTSRFVAACVVPFLLGAVYTYLVVTYFWATDGGFGSLPALLRLFQNPYVLLAGWLHYLAFDLFVGSWEVRDAQQLGIHHLVVVPALALTFMFGPVGLIVYLILRWSTKRQLLIRST